uniref:BMA-FRPR-15 n=1 Tax=Brugia malayi TaxID=6279 RepID=A0A0J9XWG7_BRUMA|nr:BMA-FRPR-15 [Brugia malayi]
MKKEALGESEENEILYCGHSYNQKFSPLQTVSRIYIIPAICIFGIIANVVNICIFSHKKMYNQLINRFLLTLAINDLMMLLATFFIFSLPVITERMENISLINISSSLLVFFYPIAHTSHTCAVYTTILVSGYRYLGICHPFLVYRNNNNSRSIHIAITSAVVFSVVFNLPRCFEFQCVPCRSEIFHRNPFLILWKYKRNKAVTIALVLLVIQFLVYNSIAFTNNILEQISTISSNSFHYRFLTELSTISISLNSATTAIYYLILSSKYQIIYQSQSVPPKSIRSQSVSPKSVRYSISLLS